MKFYFPNCEDGGQQNGLSSVRSWRKKGSETKKEQPSGKSVHNIVLFPTQIFIFFETIFRNYNITRIFQHSNETRYFPFIDIRLIGMFLPFVQQGHNTHSKFDFIQHLSFYVAKMKDTIDWILFCHG